MLQSILLILIYCGLGQEHLGYSRLRVKQNQQDSLHKGEDLKLEALENGEPVKGVAD